MNCDFPPGTGLLGVFTVEMSNLFSSSYLCCTIMYSLVHVHKIRLVQGKQARYHPYITPHYGYNKKAYVKVLLVGLNLCAAAVLLSDEGNRHLLPACMAFKELKT